MQGDKTIQFWEDYHDKNEAEEWISRPGDELNQMILDQIYSRNENKANQKFGFRKRVFSILEIGCGTSTLIRDLKKFIEERHPTVEVVAYGTDVSEVCITSNRKRDDVCARPTSTTASENDNDDGGNRIDETKKPRGLLKYEVLDVLHGEPSLKDWDLIIDKGCLDTFLFRSRTRSTSYPESLRTLLDKIHGWLTTESISNCVSTDDCKQHGALDVDMNQQRQQPTSTPSVYICITPRQKFKILRDYAGFSSVKRYPLPKTYRSKLEKKKNIKRDKEGFQSGDNDDDTIGSQNAGYMFVCSKNSSYQVGISIPFPNALNSRNTPNAENQCPNCKITFREFRNQVMKSCDTNRCTRKWIAHCMHCKNDPAKLNLRRTDCDPSITNVH